MNRAPACSFLGFSSLCLACLLPCVASLAACSSSSSGSGADERAAPPSPAPAGPVNPGESDDSKEKQKDPSTQLVIGLDAEDFASQGFRPSQVEVTAKIGGAVAAHEVLDAAAGPLFPHETRVVAPADGTDAEIEIEALLRDVEGSGPPGMPPIATRLATARFVKGATKLAYLRFEVRCNNGGLVGGSGISGPTCTNPGETCIGGACRSDALSELPDYRADWATNPPSACGSGAPEIVLGKGETEYAPVADGETLAVQEGPQCGHHVWLALGMKNLAQFGTTTAVSATQPGSSVTVPLTAYPYAYTPGTANACELPGLRFQLDVAGTPIADFLGKPLDVTVTTKDGAGREATTTRHVNIAPDFTKGPRPCP